MKDYQHLIDTQTLGPRCDITPIFSDKLAFDQLITDLSEPFISTSITHVAGIDALGFVLGTAMAIRLQKGFLPIRKGGKLPVQVVEEIFVDYTGHKKVLEIRKGMIKTGEQVLLVDEWIETGAQVQAAINIIEKEGGRIAGIATINIDINPLTIQIRNKYKCRAIMDDNKSQRDE